MSIIEDINKALAINVIKDFEQNIESYDEQYGELEGVRFGKTFYRVSSDILKPLINEIKNNPDCGYLTYVNNVIKEGFVPKHISCMVKQLKHFKLTGIEDEMSNVNDTDELNSYKEAIASQLLNYYGCPTVYNVSIKVKDKKDNDEYKILSADFMGKGTTFSTFDDYSCTLFRLETSIKNIQRKILDKIVTIDESEKTKFIEDFSMSYLVRTYVLGDGDFYHTNIGVINDFVNKKLRLINFDFEQSFIGVIIQLNRLKEDLRYLKDSNPKLYDKFLKKTDQLLKSIAKTPLTIPIYDKENPKEYIYASLRQYLDKIKEGINLLDKSTINDL